MSKFIQHLQNDIDLFMKSCEEKMVDKQVPQKEMVDKWSIKPSLADKLVDILVYLSEAKRYLRQLTEYGYLEAHGGNKNRFDVYNFSPHCEQ